MHLADILGKRARQFAFYRLKVPLAFAKTRNVHGKSYRQAAIDKSQLCAAPIANKRNGSYTICPAYKRKHFCSALYSPTANRVLSSVNTVSGVIPTLSTPSFFTPIILTP